MRRIFAVLLSAVMFLFMLTTCSQGAAIKDNEYDTTKIISSVTDSNTEFAFDIFKKLNGDDADKSIFISPLCISTALTMSSKH